MTEFDLSALVREVHDTTDLTDHRQVAKEVRQRIPDDHLEGALLDALTVYVRNMFSLFRPSIGGASFGKPGNKSQKRDSIREWWQRSLNQRYATADGQKLLRDFTRDDCMFQAEQDRKKAVELVAKAESWEQLAKRVPKNGTVGDLA